MAENFSCQIEDEKPPPPYYPDTNTNENEEITSSTPPPPSYTQSQNEPPPPSYDNLFGEIRAAQQNAEGRGHFLQSVGKIVLNTSNANHDLI